MGDESVADFVGVLIGDEAAGDFDAGAVGQNGFWAGAGSRW